MKSTRAQAHAKRPHFCTCGTVVFGNGAEWAHGAKHERRQDGHQYITQTEWERRNQALAGRVALAAR